MSMVVVVYIINEHATATINTKGCTLMIDVEEHEQKRKKKKEKNVHGRIRTCDLLLVKPT